MKLLEYWCWIFLSAISEHRFYLPFYCSGLLVIGYMRAMSVNMRPQVE
jgi:hypothetical protein